jgi:predicted nucleotidyltransferase
MRGKQLASLRLRDRDAIVAENNMIFRVYGYSHPPNGYICDPEYAPADIYKSREPRAYRAKGKEVYFKFFSDESLKFVQQNYPQYMVFYEPLHRNLVGVKEEQIIETRQTDIGLQSLLEKQPKDTLLEALHELFHLLLQRSSLSKARFGVFGSLLHSFYHPLFSDIDLIIYGGDELRRLKDILATFYGEDGSPLRNEFDSMKSVEGKNWNFQNYSLSEYVWHQKRKQVYAIFHDKGSGRTIKTEFEPVKRWEEIESSYESKAQIMRKGWIKLLARVTNDKDAPYMPSVYQIETLKILEGEHVNNIRRVISYVEEFRLQAKKDEVVVVEGNLECMNESQQTFHQITLTYCPRYYEQVLKIENQSLR